MSKYTYITLREKTKLKDNFCAWFRKIMNQAWQGCIFTVNFLSAGVILGIQNRTVNPLGISLAPDSSHTGKFAFPSDHKSRTTQYPSHCCDHTDRENHILRIKASGQKPDPGNGYCSPALIPMSDTGLRQTSRLFLAKHLPFLKIETGSPRIQNAGGS